MFVIVAAAGITFQAASGVFLKTLVLLPWRTGVARPQPAPDHELLPAGG